jgi:hypothetical protein
MIALRVLFDEMAKAVPGLHRWASSLPDDETLATEWSELAYELVDLASEDTISALNAIAPFIEEGLEQYDDRDQVSLGFIETLIGLMEEKRLDPLRVRSTLGPRARVQWDDLADHRHQQDWSLVDFRSRHVEGFVPGPARLDQWLVEPGARVPAGTSLARLTVGGATYELVATLPCRVARFAVAGHELAEESLLLYVLPEDYRQFRRPSPYVTLRMESRT